MNIDPQNVEISELPTVEDKVEYQHNMTITVKNPSDANNYLYNSYKSGKNVDQFKYGKLELPLNNTDHLKILVSEINNKTKGQTEYTVNIVTYYGSDTWNYIEKFFERYNEN